MSAKSDLARDLLTGADDIARYVGWPRRRIYHLARCGHLPIRRVGALLIARKSEIDAALSGIAALADREIA